MKIVWSPLARLRALEISEYIAKESPQASIAWLESIFEAVERLEDFPESGRYLPEVDRKDLREVLSGDYRIVYRILGDEVQILTVRHGRQLLSLGEL